MRELDDILEPYLSELSEKDEKELTELSKLLEQEDDQLLDWLLGRITPQDPGLACLVAKIRQTRSECAQI